MPLYLTPSAPHSLLLSRPATSQVLDAVQQVGASQSAPSAIAARTLQATAAPSFPVSKVSMSLLKPISKCLDLSIPPPPLPSQAAANDGVHGLPHDTAVAQARSYRLKLVALSLGQNVDHYSPVGRLRPVGGSNPRPRGRSLQLRLLT